MTRGRPRREPQRVPLYWLLAAFVVGNGAWASHQIVRVHRSGTLETSYGSALAAQALATLLGCALVLAVHRLSRRGARDRLRQVMRYERTRLVVRSQREALLAGDRNRKEFLAVLAHELRNPLAALRNATEVLRLAKSDSAEGDQARHILERQVRQLARVVDDLIDVARLSSGRLILRRAPMTIRDAVEAAVETTAPLLRERRHELRVSLPNEPLVVDGDPLRLAQLLANLLANAAKFTDPCGHVALRVWRSDTHVTLCVEDDGVGIAPELLPHVFDLFRQGDGARRGGQGGLGIGLTLARRIVELHGGTITAASPGKGRGSRVLATLPLCDARARSA